MNTTQEQPISTPYVESPVPVYTKFYVLSITKELTTGSQLRTLDYSVRSLPISKENLVYKHYYVSEQLAEERGKFLVDSNPDLNITYKVQASSRFNDWNHCVDDTVIPSLGSTSLISAGPGLIITGSNIEEDYMEVLTSYH